MAQQPRLLVVDDEEAICEGCSRIFSRQGFDVSKSSSARDGLNRAQTEDYSAVLLDIKMPEMSGLEFLSQLREQQVDVPVILMTGFPSMPNAISAVRLGASGYVTKPFTPEEITQAVHQFVPPAKTATPADDDVAPEPVSGETRLFWQEAWIQPNGDDLVRVGAVLPGIAVVGIQKVELPRIGEVVHQGLPMARITLADGKVRLVPAPMTGLVENCNTRLMEEPGWLYDEPCGRGWIAELCATRVGEDVNNCIERQVTVVSNDQARSEAQAARLAAQGCTAEASLAPMNDAAWEEFNTALSRSGTSVIMLDAASLGEAGPDLVSRIHAHSPAAKVVVLASPECNWEAAYRSRKIFYYGVDMFDDHEITDVLDSAFRGGSIGRAKPARSSRNNESVANIAITNRLGAKVTLIAAPGLLFRNSGLGAEIRALLHQGLFPLQTMPGISSVAPRDVLNEAYSCDAVILLLARDTGRLPGALSRNSASEFTALTDGNATKVTTLVIQPTELEDGSVEFDERTTAQLAQHIVAAMSSAAK